MSKVLVTGGAGFIGSVLVKYLIKVYGYQVVNYDKFTDASNLTALKEVKNESSYEIVKGDICDSHNFMRVFEKYQPIAIFYLAAESHVDNSIEQAVPFIETNILGTCLLWEAAVQWHQSCAVEKPYRFVHVSTDQMYGSLGQVYNINGGTELANNELANRICQILDKKCPRKDRKSYCKQLIIQR